MLVPITIWMLLQSSSQLVCGHGYYVERNKKRMWEWTRCLVLHRVHQKTSKCAWALSWQLHLYYFYLVYGPLFSLSLSLVVLCIEGWHIEKYWLFAILHNLGARRAFYFHWSFPSLSSVSPNFSILLCLVFFFFFVLFKVLVCNR